MSEWLDHEFGSRIWAGLFVSWWIDTLCVCDQVINLRNGTSVTYACNSIIARQ